MHGTGLPALKIRHWLHLDQIFVKIIVHPSSSVYSTFSYRVGLPQHNAPFPGVLMKSIGAAFLRPDALPDVNHLRGMQCQIVLNTILHNTLEGSGGILKQKCLHNAHHLNNRNIDL